ncbi:MAG TPA: DUF6221 family protein [Pseudonocardiaceae bacterium]|jgi:hypothetical protein|nr:DUF6221 family protein [Pseudonocardiaceae bacterium]
MTDDLTEQLLAAMERVEQVARAAEAESPSPWLRGDVYSIPSEDRDMYRQIYDRTGNVVVYDEGAPGPDVADLIAHNDPASVLRRCAADRKILAEHGQADFGAYGDRLCRRCRYEDDELEPDELHHWVVWPCPTLTALAEAYGITTEETEER